MKTSTKNAHIFFLFLAVLSLLMFFQPLKELTKFSFNNHYYTHIWLIPLASLYFIFNERKDIFAYTRFSPRVGVILLLAGTASFFAAKYFGKQLNVNDHTAAITFSGLLFLHGAFFFSYGSRAYRNALFPLFFLIFMIPIPSFLMDRIIDTLVAGSAHTTEMLFRITDTPYIRTDRIFQLPGINIEIADACSGIRSSIALVITMTVAGHMFLSRPWTRIVLILVVIPLTILKNAIRITTLSLLAIHVDVRFLTQSFLHHSGGIFFFLPSLFLLGLLLWGLRKAEGTPKRRLQM
jgi:exosortase